MTALEMIRRVLVLAKAILRPSVDLLVIDEDGNGEFVFVREIVQRGSMIQVRLSKEDVI
jgi:hypothetical protein